MALDDSFFKAKTLSINGIKFSSGESLLIETDNNSLEIKKPFYYSPVPHEGIFHIYKINQEKKCIEHMLIPVGEINDISIFVEKLGVKKDGNSKRNKEKPKNAK